MNDTKKKTKVVIIVFFIILVTIVVGGFFLIKKGIFLSNIRKETITAENYEEIFNRISEELKDTDDIYYLSYSVMYYMMKDGISSTLNGNEDENAMYVNIYEKTVQQLIDEGKQLMIDNNVSIEEFKENIKDLENLDNNLNSYTE